MRGRKPKPTATKLLEGNPGKRRLPRNEPTPAPGIPACPAHLNKDAQNEWDRITRELSKLGLLTLVDRAALAAYCAAYSRWCAAELQLAKGAFYKANGLKKVHPAVRVAHDAMLLMHKYLSDFGLSPASRARLGTSEPEAEDEYEKFLRTG